MRARAARATLARARGARGKTHQPSNDIILVDLGDFGQIPGPSSVLFGRVLRVRVLRFCVIIIYCALN